jgi:tRNA pseudouridine55 synthase
VYDRGQALKTTRMQDTILLIDKPKGMSSFAVVSSVRRVLKERNPNASKSELKVGHAGTLDPLASGLLVLGIGQGTKELARYVGLTKEYVADVLIGVRTSTGDLEGELVEEKWVERDALTAEKVKSVLESMVGTLVLPVSAYSAMKQGGEALYKKVRRGATDFVLPKREMEVKEANLQDRAVNDYDDEHGLALVRIVFCVGSGTYVRSIAEELGRRLGYPATLSDLRRTRVGEWHVEKAHKLEEWVKGSE